MRWLLYVVAGLAALFALAFLVGLLLPKTHHATVRAHFRQPPESLYNAILDVAHAPDWRTGLDSARVVSNEGERLEWQESSKFGVLKFVLDDARPPKRIVSRIADTSQGFGGSWTYEITPDANGSVVSITENGEVYNPLFRFMTRFIFGYYRTLELYERDLGKRFGETVQTERAQ